MDNRKKILRNRMRREKEIWKQEKKRRKWKEKRWKRINTKIERTAVFLAIVVCIVSSVLEAQER